MFKKVMSYESPTNKLHVDYLVDEEVNEIIRVYNLPDDEILEVPEATRKFRTIFSLMRQGIEIQREWIEIQREWIEIQRERMKIADQTALVDRYKVSDELEMEENAVIMSIMAIAFGKGVCWVRC